MIERRDRWSSRLRDFASWFIDTFPLFLLPTPLSEAHRVSQALEIRMEASGYGRDGCETPIATKKLFGKRFGLAKASHESIASVAWTGRRSLPRQRWIVPVHRK